MCILVYICHCVGINKIMINHQMGVAYFQTNPLGNPFVKLSINIGKCWVPQFRKRIFLGKVASPVDGWRKWVFSQLKWCQMVEIDRNGPVYIQGHRWWPNQVTWMILTGCLKGSAMGYPKCIGMGWCQVKKCLPSQGLPDAGVLPKVVIMWWKLPS